MSQYLIPIRMDGSAAEEVDAAELRSESSTTTVITSSASEGISLEIVNSNLLRLMAHLGIDADRRGMSPLTLNGNSAPASPVLRVADLSRLKPRCPWCHSCKFANEKNFVAHLNHAEAMIGHVATSSKSCRFSADLHSEMMGLTPGSGTNTAASAFMKGYRKHFVASELDGFNAERCASAQAYLSERGVADAPQ